jgi:hypothetical protein
MQLKTRPIIFILIGIIAITTATFFSISYFRYTSTSAVLNYIRTHADNVAVLCARPGRPNLEFTQNENERFPLAASYNLVLISAYADQVSKGQIDPTEVIPLTDLDRFLLPGTDGGALYALINSLGTGRTSLTMDELAQGILVYGSNAAADYLASRLQGLDFSPFFGRMGLTNTHLQGSYLGLFLYLNNHETGLFAEEDLTPKELLNEQTRLANLYLTDLAWRDAERKYTGIRSNNAPLGIQKQVFSQFGMQGSASELATIVSAIYSPPGVMEFETQNILRRLLEWPNRFNPSKTTDFKTLASAGGAWPGTFANAWYAENAGSESTVLVVLYRDMPDDFWNTWATAFSHQKFENLVLSNSDCAQFTTK